MPGQSFLIPMLLKGQLRQHLVPGMTDRSNTQFCFKHSEMNRHGTELFHTWLSVYKAIDIPLNLTHCDVVYLFPHT